MPEEKIVVEIDGEPWHGRLCGDRDERRDADLQAQGWTVLRFCSKSAKQDPAAVAEAVIRLAMNHSDQYQFDYVEVVDTSRRHVSNKILYNFGVDSDESYIIGRGIVVHNCRGSWLPEIEFQAGDDPEFSQWLKDTLSRKDDAAPISTTGVIS